MDDRLKELMQELGNAINESLSDSDRIAAAIGEIKRAGYDVFLVLEATIGFNKRAVAPAFVGRTVTTHPKGEVSLARISKPSAAKDVAEGGAEPKRRTDKVVCSESARWWSAASSNDPLSL